MHLRAPNRMMERRIPFACLALLALATMTPPVAAQIVPAGFQDKRVVTGLDFPVGLAGLPDGRILIIEQKTARIRLLDGLSLSSMDPVTTIDRVQTQGSERGLLGIAVDPGWPARPYVYVHCNDLDGFVRISRYTATGDLTGSGSGQLSIDPATRYDLVNDIPDNRDNHNGGTVRFGPDGMLYASLGEDANPCAAQDRVSLRGVILRMDVSRLPASGGGPAPRALITAAGNPFTAMADSNAHLVWAYGFRNPFRFHIDPRTGDLAVGDVGESLREELDVAEGPGLNFGWPAFEGTVMHPVICPVQGSTSPVYEYDASRFTASIISAGFYRRPAVGLRAFPLEYDGDIFFSDYYQGFLRRLTRAGQAWVLAPAVPGQAGTDWGQGFQNVSDWYVSRDGALWYCRQSVGFQPGSGQVHRIAYGTFPDSVVPAATFARPFPIPAVNEVNLSYTLPRAATVSLHVYDAQGCLISTVVPRSTQTASTYDLIWNGRNERGEDVPAGMYFVRLRVDGQDLCRRIPLIR